MVETLEHLKLIVDHLLVAFDILLQYYFDSNLDSIEICFAHNTVGASSECSPEFVLRLLVVAVGLAMKFVHEILNYRTYSQSQLSEKLRIVEMNVCSVEHSPIPACALGVFDHRLIILQTGAYSLP